MFLWRKLLTLVILIAVSFIMLWVGDKLNASGMVLTRFMARAQAPLTAHLYPDNARDQITVLLYDDEYLESNGSAWPISYQEHADGLLRFVGTPGSKPKAIFLDVTFGQHREDPTLPALKSALCAIQNEFKVPVFLAALPSAKDGRLSVRSGLGGDNSGKDRACFTLVGVDYIPDALDGITWSYQLTRHFDQSSWKSGPADNPAQQVSYRSAAMAIAQDSAKIDLGIEKEPMAMVWGYNSAPQSSRPNSLKDCTPGVFDWEKLIPWVLRQFWEDPPKHPLCPYHQTISMAQLGLMSDDEIAPYIDGRYLMVGGQVLGYNDIIESPIHGSISGIHMHAMALDNLLTYRENYKQSAAWTMPPSLDMFVPGLLGICAILFVQLVANAIKKARFLTRLGLPGWGRTPDVCSKCQMTQVSRKVQVIQFLFGVAFWLIKLTVQTIIAMLLIGWLQAHFRIGMLPVVELVGMSLVAEGLQYVQKIQSFLSRRSPAAA